MRFSSTQSRTETIEDLSGHLIVAHPSLRDKQFCHTVVLICKHIPKQGALGVVLNRPMGIFLEQVDGAFAYDPMGPVPLYFGGPIQKKQLILTAWQWTYEHDTFKLYFGIDEAKARDLVTTHSDLQMRGYLGHSSWGPGQLENEIALGVWVATHKREGSLYDRSGEELWSHLLKQEHPEWCIGSLPQDAEGN